MLMSGDERCLRLQDWSIPDNGKYWRGEIGRNFTAAQWDTVRPEMLSHVVSAVPRLHGTARCATVTRVAVGDCVACRQWFGYYVPYITHYAALAESLKVERFSVGLELVDASGQSSHWRDVVQNVRKAYNGPLVYGTAL